LLVDPDPSVPPLIARACPSDALTLMHEPTLAAARRRLAGQKVDLALLAAVLPDGAGMTLLRDIHAASPGTQTILLTDTPSVEQTVHALRHGAGDVLVKPFNEAEVAERVGQALARHRTHRLECRRQLRLRRLCRQLHRSRQEVTQQVDTLCSDLVKAYQDLAGQMNQVVQTSEFTGILRQELDLENLVRKVLQFGLDKAGPTNAAIFLPGVADEYSVGGYVNYDSAAGTTDLILNHLADVLAPKLAKLDTVLHIADNAGMTQWLGDDAAYLADCHLLAVTARYEGDPLAILLFFRDQSQPFDPALVEICRSIAGPLGGYLARIIKIHHRHLPG
jgi:DNA-binding response OmpR family regulator